jgi:hypothetical protein
VTTDGRVELRLDDLTLADASASTSVDILAAPGLHFLELVADVASADRRVGLALTGPDGIVRQLARAETYRLMDAPWGLLAHVARPPRARSLGGPADASLDATIAMAFSDPELGSVSAPNSITWSGSLLASHDGVYRMAFASEDPMHLEIDGRPVDVVCVNPDQWRSVGLGSQVHLGEGWHSVRVTLEVTHGGRELARWNWVPPTASGAADTAAEWSVVPPSALRPDPPVAVAPAAPR